MEHNEFKQTAIEPREETLPAIADDMLIILAERAEARAEAMQKIKRVALKLTNSHDWVDQNGKPYLQASGAEKVARLFGISWRISEPIQENLDGGHFSYTYTGEFSLSGATIEAVGSRSSKDGFFKKYRYKGPEDNRKRVELPVSEIDKGDVKKSAYTNLLGNGITRLLGIRNLTYGDLEEFAGIKQEHITSVGYKKKGKPLPDKQSPKPNAPSAPAPAPAPVDPNAPATEAQIRAIHALLGKLELKDEFIKHEKVSKLIGMETVISSMSKLSKGQASTAIKALQTEAGNGGK